MASRSQTLKARANAKKGTKKKSGTLKSGTLRSAQESIGGKEQTQTVRVMVRFRPERDIEFSATTSKKFTVYYGEDEKSIQLEQTEKGNSKVLQRSYTFDHVFGPNATQDYVFDKMARGPVEDVVKGFNGTIFAYGQTGSGKTYSMFGPEDKPITGSGRGIIPRCAEHLFEKLQQAEEVRQVTIKLSFLEIYKERVRDLLNPNSDDNLKLRETPRGAIRVLGLTEEYVSSPEDVLKMILQGNSIRATSATNMNDVSSRSHSVIMLTVTEKLKDASIRVGKLNLADLAGSERADKSGLVGGTLAEAKKINQSLSSLGNCINALTSQGRSHVPFRDSKLTYLLKDSLGGNTKTSLLVACSPHAANSDETLSSLTFAQRASHVKNSVRINRQLSVNELQTLVQKLRQQLSLSQQRIKEMETKGPGGDSGGLDMDYDETEPEDMEMLAMMGARTLPDAGQMAAYQQAQMGQDYAQQQQGGQHMQMDKFGRLQQAQTASHTLPAALPSNPMSAFAMGDMGDQAVPANSILASNSMAIRQRLMMKQRLYKDVQGLSGEADGSGINPDSETGSVLQRAKAAIRRSLASRSSLDPMASENQEDDDRPSKSGSTYSDDSDDDDSHDSEAQREREIAKKKLQEELRAAKKRREEIRQAQRKRADVLAAKKLGGGLEDELALQDQIAQIAEQASRDLEEAEMIEREEESHKKKKKKKEKKDKKEKKKKHKSKRANDLTVHTDDGDVPEKDSPEEWSPVTSPVPPPPSYPYPRTPTAAGGPKHEEPEEDDDDDDVPTIPKDDIKRERQQRRNARTGMTEYRIELLPDPDGGGDGEVEQLGHVELKNADMKLEDFRSIVLEELDDVPPTFIFTRKGVPIGVRQERKRTVDYVADANDVIQIRLDSSSNG